MLPPLLSSLLLDEQLAAINTAASAATDKNFAIFIAEPLLLRYYKTNIGSLGEQVFATSDLQSFARPKTDSPSLRAHRR